MRATLPLVALLGLSACVVGPPPVGDAAFPAEPEGPPRVAFVTATGSRVVVTMTDRARCLGVRPEGVNTGWSGVTTECGYQLPYTVEFRTGARPGRFGIEEGFGVGGAPRAEVFVTDTDGQRKLFLAPLGRGVTLSTAPAG